MAMRTLRTKNVGEEKEKKICMKWRDCNIGFGLGIYTFFTWNFSILDFNKPGLEENKSKKGGED